MKNSQHKISVLSDVINRAVAGPHVTPLNAKNSISPKGELLLYGVIGDWWDGMDALTIVRELEQLPGSEIVVRIQSPGGNVTEGLAMYNRLKQSTKRIIVYIDGIAASMGAGVAMAGDVIYIPTNAMMMLHKPSLDGVGGNENDLRDLADALAKMEQSYVQIHADKTGKSTDEIKALIADGKNHFFVGQEAVDYGLADEIIQSVSLDATACMKFTGMDIPQKITASLFTKPAAAAAQPQEENEMIKIKAKKGGWHFVPAINAALNGSYGKIEEAVAALKDKVTVTNLASILDGTAECDHETLKAIGAEFGIDVKIESAESSVVSSDATGASRCN
jgi:ATP-dependent Clp endopeptidase proteolytic subunit ClpP